MAVDYTELLIKLNYSVILYQLSTIIIVYSISSEMTLNYYQSYEGCGMRVAGVRVR